MRSINCHIIVTALALVFLSVVVGAADYMYWSSDFEQITLANISSRTQVSEGSATVTLNTTGDAQIYADNTTGGPAELSCATNDTLVTEYKLTFDGDGSSDTGGNATSYEAYDSFLSTPALITYITDDNDVDVTFWVRASNRNDDEVADSGTYSATQTLTISWVGP